MSWDKLPPELKHRFFSTIQRYPTYLNDWDVLAKKISSTLGYFLLALPHRGGDLITFHWHDGRLLVDAWECPSHYFERLKNDLSTIFNVKFVKPNKTLTLWDISYGKLISAQKIKGSPPFDTININKKRIEVSKNGQKKIIKIDLVHDKAREFMHSKISSLIDCIGEDKVDEVGSRVDDIVNDVWKSPNILIGVRNGVESMSQLIQNLEVIPKAKMEIVRLLWVVYFLESFYDRGPISKYYTEIPMIKISKLPYKVAQKFSKWKNSYMNCIYLMIKYKICFSPYNNVS
jgi:hypothetical protein